jgi:hypothetical protein
MRDHEAATAYIGEYTLLMFTTLAVLPLLIVFNKPSGGDAADHTMAVEL